MNNEFSVEARNNLLIPIRLVILEHGNIITIAICEETESKDDYNSIRISKNLEACMDTWKPIGLLTVDSRPYLNFQAVKKVST